MKKIILLLLIAFNSLSQTTYTVTSPGDGGDISTNYATTYASMTTGDTMILPEGQFTIGAAGVSTLNSTKRIKIRGSGRYKTTLYRPESAVDNSLASVPMIQFTINASITSGIEVTDLTLRSKRPSVVSGDGLSVASDVGISMNGVVDFVIQNVTFKYFGFAGAYIVHDNDLSKGLITNCFFYNNAKGPTALGLGYGVVVYGGDVGRSTINRDGTSNYIYVERSTIQFSRHALATGGNGCYVGRGNQILDCVAASTLAPATEGHPPRGSGNPGNVFGCRAAELYRNTYINTRNMSRTRIVSGQAISTIQETVQWFQSGQVYSYNNRASGFRIFFGAGMFIGDAFTPVSSAQAWGDVPTSTAHSGAWTYSVSPSTDYPVTGQAGYDSALLYGPSDSSDDPAHIVGDQFYAGNSMVIYQASGGGYSVPFNNYGLPLTSGTTTTFFGTNHRDIHQDEIKPGYTAYVYPHPLTK